MSARMHGFGVTLLLAASASLLLAACTPPGAEPSPAPTSETSEPDPTPTSEAEVVSAPEPALEADCSDLASTASVTSALGAGISAVDPAASTMGAYPVISPSYFVRSLGGLACEWSNGQPQSNRAGSNPAYVGARVLVLPNATGQWTRYLDYYGPEVEDTFCSGGYCSVDAYVGTTWVHVQMSGATSDAAAAALGAEIVATVSAAGPGAAPWAVPAETQPLPADCPSLISDADVQASLGIGVPLVATTAAGGWSIEAGAEDNWQGPACHWSFLDADAGVGGLTTLVAGKWAWDEAREFLTVPSTPVAVLIAGLDAGDEAWLRCDAADSTCLVDLVIGGNWIQVYVWPDDVMGLAYDKRDGALAIAERIVANITP